MTRSVRAAARATVFFLKLLPMLPSRFLNRVTPSLLREPVEFASPFGQGKGDLYRPSTPGRHPAVVVSLGVVPFGFDHPQIPRLGEALARSGFAALLYRSPIMEDLRLDPVDVGNIASAYEYLLDQPFVAKERSGLFGTCVGGSFALLAAAHPAIRDRVAFVGVFAPYASMRTLALEIATSTRTYDGQTEPWQVDQLTRRVFVHSLTAGLGKGEADQLRMTLEAGWGGVDTATLTRDARGIHALLTAPDIDAAREAVDRLPATLLARLDETSPLEHVQDIHAPLIVLGHDRDDLVIPVGESRLLRSALASRPGLRYTEFAMFQHADPTKRKLRPTRLIWELGKFYRYVYPLFKVTART